MFSPGLSPFVFVSQWESLVAISKIGFLRGRENPPFQKCKITELSLYCLGKHIVLVLVYLLSHTKKCTHKDRHTDILSCGRLCVLHKKIQEIPLSLCQAVVYVGFPIMAISTQHWNNVD